MPLSPGTRLGPYAIQSAIGAGGMGEVYRVTDLRLEREVAVKILPPQFTHSPLALERFQREAKAIAALKHPNICAIYDVGQAVLASETVHFLVMELLEGETLQRRLSRGPLAVGEFLDVATALADALDAAHRRGIVHRDVKPGNVFLTAHGPKLLDFGLAKTIGERPRAGVGSEVETVTAEAMLTGPGAAIGTLAYMSPEQIRGQELDARTDLFSLGLVLYEMAAGVAAFAGNTGLAVAAAILGERPRSPRELRPDLPPQIDEIILKAIDKNRETRSQTAAELGADLKRLKRDTTGDLLVETGPSRSARVKVAAAVALVVGLATAIYLTTRRETQTTQPGSQVTTTQATPVPVQAPPVIPPADRVPADAPAVAATPARPVANESSSSGFSVAQLTITGTAFRPTISADGKWVAYVQRDAGSDSLWLRQASQNRAASNVQIVAPEAGIQLLGATMTPDGTQVDFVRDSGGTRYELWRVPVLGGTRKRLVDHADSFAGWSPNGRQMAFLRRDLENQTTALVAADGEGKQERIVSVRKLPLNYPLMFSRNGNGFQRPAWSPDGSSVALIGSTETELGRQVVVVDVTSGRERVTRLRGQLLELAWLDSRALIMNWRPEAGAPIQLWRMSFPEGTMSRITNDASSYSGLSLTADRTALVTAARAARISLWVGDDTGKRGTEFFAPALGMGRTWPGGTSIVWAGEKLLYPVVVGARTSILSVDPGNGEPEEVTAGTSPAVSADGRTIAYIVGNQLWKAEADGRHAVRLAEGHPQTPAITHEGQVIFRQGQNLLTVALTGGKPRVFVVGPATQPRVSPDGQYLMYGTVDDQHPNGILAICELPGCASRRMYSPPQGSDHHSWMPDGHVIIYALQGNLWAEPLDGGKPSRITQFTNNTVAGFAWSRDGKRLAVSRSALMNDIILFGGLTGIR